MAWLPLLVGSKQLCIIAIDAKSPTKLRLQIFDPISSRNFKFQTFTKFAEALACKSIAKDYLVFNDDVCGAELEIEVMAQPDLDSVHLVMEFFQRMQEREAVVVFRNLMV